MYKNDAVWKIINTKYVIITIQNILPYNKIMKDFSLILYSEDNYLIPVNSINDTVNKDNLKYSRFKSSGFDLTKDGENHYTIE
jgi:hypothetical protein